MPFRLAITVAGAVSLGTYESGVLYEIIEAIGQHNSNPATPAGNKVVIDVLTGASAGGISATLLAQKLLYESGSLSGAYTNALYRAWVEDLQFEPLMALAPAENPAQSILSSNHVDTVSARYLTQRYSTHLTVPPDPHPATAGTVQLGLALSNLNGVDYQYVVHPGGTFTYTQFQDQLQATIDNSADNIDFWEPLRRAAVSCSAFPFAFKVRDLVRHKSEFDSPNVVFPLPFETFTYTDGGTFQNQPLGLAKSLVNDIDPTHTSPDPRFYLFIAPHAKTSVANTTFNEKNADFYTLASQLINAVFGQAGFQDWIQAEDINQQVRLFNARAEGLKSSFMNPPQLDPGPLQTASNELLPRLFQSRPPGAESLADARQRLKTQFGVEYQELTNGPGQAAANAWIDSILTLETAADLGERDVMTIYGITADSSELAGAGLQAFLGFFEQEYRDHDYDVGRMKARSFLDPAKNALPANQAIFQNSITRPLTSGR
jgi:Patatin-like phospholipase